MDLQTVLLLLPCLGLAVLLGILIGIGYFGNFVAQLLGFRTNQAYERWWEARIIWGAIVNDSRTLIWQTISLYDRSDVQYVYNVKEMTKRQFVWCYALGEYLRNLPFSSNVASYVRFERIKNTDFPKAHSLLIHLIIYVFATMLPFGLSDNDLSLEIGLTIAIPIIFIAIKKTSILMQGPFENDPMDTPMIDQAQTIEIKLKEMIGDVDFPFKMKPNKYYIL
ncbi:MULTISPECIES: bestrophin family ion channel [unclassified Arenibacter]|jgi:putative membrane protein|uniref:bestrophin family ion channel n=1 Tax=unclassified Arenibacter TaxID=2615047 RepID=UPI001FF4DC03|nr:MULTISPECIES: bestrophin family ion channel [unclassified Arenibacter]MCK0137166.1 hypothetical protein [Arenibacter sp. S6351L]MCK0189102.1 hypothetical protein [Arenibacter sp. F20364]|tara:strand:+ start:2192 stop:2857 length:666 start_codon:yes stop_codon:yes gene_type:complete